MKLSEISQHIWHSKYRRTENSRFLENSIEETWMRVANALASAEKADQKKWGSKFFDLLSEFKFLPGGRILAGAGTSHDVTLLNCFVMGIIDDSLDGIFGALREGALTMQMGGGVGYDFSSLRPLGSPASRTGAIASGPVSFMRIWNTMCATILSTGARRGAMMGTLRCDHPDVEIFIQAKQRQGELNHFNLSVLVTDTFMSAVDSGADWELRFPCSPQGHIYKTVKARQLWDQIMDSTYQSGEPGVLFIDRINELNNLWYKNSILTTNPCGEIPLPSYGACDLGSLNLVSFIKNPLSAAAEFNWKQFADLIPSAVRFLDNVSDLSKFPLPAQQALQLRQRRIGLGITGLGTALAQLGIPYESPAARDLAARIMRTLRDCAYEASVELAKEKGAFPDFDASPFCKSRFVQALPSSLQKQIERTGIRNSHLLAIAPTGTISLLANNVSSGIEPIYDFDYDRYILDVDGEFKRFKVTDYAVQQWRQRNPNKALPDYFSKALSISPEAQLQMVLTLQPFVDQSISKTINVSEDYPYEDFKDIYVRAYRNGAKGCTTFRPNVKTGPGILRASAD